MIKKNSRVLVTGACGSIGSKVVKKALDMGCVVCAFDHSEDGLFKLDQLHRSDYGGNLKLFIGSIRSEKRLSMALEGVDVVFHCAALKHVYLSEYNPFEAMQTNIIGTNNIINASISANVKKVIFTSSDKAVNPSSTMGATKLLGERLIIAANHHSGEHSTKFSSVRFGNVLDTNGSILSIFRKQILKKAPLTITSEKMTRFFISMEQSVELCFYAAQKMIGGEIFSMSMGSCSIMDLAEVVSQGKSFDYKVIGEKPGEKLYEELVTETEAPRTTFCDGVYIIIPETLDLMRKTIKDTYLDIYSNTGRLEKPLRSDENLLTKSQISQLLKSSEIF